MYCVWTDYHRLLECFLKIIVYLQNWGNNYLLALWGCVARTRPHLRWYFWRLHALLLQDIYVTMSTPLRRSRSITRKDKERDSPPRVVANPQQLFDLCVESILESSEVSGKAVVHLPHVYAQYILCLALKRLKEGKLPSNSILHKLITCWPHSELSFNFRSNPLVVKKLGSLQPVSYTWSFGCIEPHVYYNIRGVSKSRYSTCSREIAVGLFNQAYRSDQLNIPVSMGTVDLSDFEQFSSECGTSFLDTGIINTLCGPFEEGIIVSCCWFN